MMYFDDAVSQAETVLSQSNYASQFEGLSNLDAGIKGLLVGVCGMLMVFLVLTLLMYIVKLLGWIINRPAKTSPVVDIQKSDSDDIAVSAPVQPEATTDDTALIAVITAAVAAFREASGAPADSSFRVVSFKKNSKIRK